MKTTMNAVISTGYGTANVLKYTITDKPKPAPKEVLIQVHATAVTAAHTAMRTGYPLFGRLFMGVFKPKNQISGTDFAGEIVALGADVTKFSVGEKVFGSTDLEGGSYAEFLTLSEDLVLLKKPRNLSFAQATAIIDGATTAYPFLVNHGSIKKGDNVLIIGGSGSIGTASIQLAKNFGAEVTAVTSTQNIGMVKSIGADFVIDYTQEDFTKNELTYDIIFDTVGVSSFSRVKKLLSPSGVYLSPVLGLRMFVDMIKTSVKKGKKAIFDATGLRKNNDKLADFKLIKELLEQGKLSPVIDRTYQLPQLSEAHRYVEKGHKKGNVVIDITGEAHS